MATILEWIKRIIKIGILEFLSKLGLRVWIYLVGAVLAALAVIMVLVAIIIAIIV